jgi:hypothetical protein
MFINLIKFQVNRGNKLEFPNDYRGGIAGTVIIVSIVAGFILMFRSFFLGLLLLIIAALLIWKILRTEPEIETVKRLGLNFAILSAFSLLVMPILPINGLSIVLLVPSTVAALATGMALVKESQSKIGLLMSFLSLLFLMVFSLFLAADFISCCGLQPLKTPSCEMQEGLSCRSFHLSSDTGKLSLTLTNDLSVNLMVTGISCTKGGHWFEPCNNSRCIGFDPGKMGVLLSPKAASEFLLECKNESTAIKFTKGSPFEGSISVEYRLGDESRSRQNLGDIYVRADQVVNPNVRPAKSFSPYAAAGWVFSGASLIILLFYKFLKQ